MVDPYRKVVLVDRRRIVRNEVIGSGDRIPRSIWRWHILQQVQRNWVQKIRRNNVAGKRLARIAPFLPRYRPRTKGVVNHNLRSEEHTSELQSQSNLVCRLLLEK